MTLPSLLQYSILGIAVAHFLFPYFPNISPVLFGEKQVFITQAFMALAVVFGAIHFTRRRETPFRKHWRELLPLALALLIMAASTVIHQGFDLERLFSLFAIALIVGLFTILELPVIHRLLILGAWVTIAASFLGFLQYYLSDIFSPAEHLGYAANTYYASGFANMPSSFGQHLAIFLPLFWVLGVMNYSGRRRLWLLTFFIGVPALVLTFSRSAWLDVAVAGILALILLLRLGYEKRVMVYSLGVAFILATAVFIIPVPRWTIFNEWRNSPQEIMQGRLSSEDQSARSRVAFHIAAKSMASLSVDSFLFGIGAKGFYDRWQEFKPMMENIDTRLKVDPHSMYLEVFTGGGIAALAALLLFFVLLYFKLWRAIPYAPLALPLIAALTAVMFEGLFHNVFYSKFAWIISGLILAVTSVSSNKSQEN